MNERTRMAVVGMEPTDEPFSFGDFVAIASARGLFGPVVVHAAHLPYGFWWDTLRTGVELIRTGEPVSDPLPLGGLWATAEEFIEETDARFYGAAAIYRTPLLEV